MANGKAPGASGGGSQTGTEMGGDDWQTMMQDRVNKLASQVQSQGSDIADMAESGIREWPMSSVLGALAIGVAVGFVLGRSV